MKKRKQYSICLILASMFWILTVSFAFSGEEPLFLTGVIKTVDIRSGILTIDVKSNNCHGIRRFRVDDTGAYRGLEGAEICFYIDSSSCRSAKITKVIRLSRGGRP